MPIKFRKVHIAAEGYETAGVFDVNGDGVLDIVSGGVWYEGPDFKKRHPIGQVQRISEYYDDFSTVAMDVNGDGRTDFVTGGWWGDTIRWRENPGDPNAEWPEHVIASVGNVETTRAWDIDGDGQLEVIPNTPGGPVRIFKLVTDANGKGMGEFNQHVAYGKAQGHGLGFGDIDGDGKGEILLAGGYLKQPAGGPYAGEWSFVPAWDFGGASIPILAADVNGDGVTDIIVGQAHGYGLDWYEQKRDGGSVQWIKHPIDPFNSQYHDMHWVDIDGDGQNELVTGKRFRAHCGNDPGEFDDIGIYYFKWNGESFTRMVIDFGPAGQASGCGIHFCLADLRGTGRLDIIAPGKDGLQVFYNEGA